MKPFIAVFCVILLFSCHKKEMTPTPANPTNPTNPTNPQTSVSLDSLSNRLQFTGATKKPGSIPKGPAGSGLKISLGDTLFLVDQIKIPIKFLHMDTTKNVSGIFLQVQALIGGSFASYYYDVPELAVTDSSDTVSVIMIGIDPTDLKLPTSFNIVITPYNSSHLPIDSAVKPVKIVEHKTNPKGTNGKCGLVNPQDETWDWVMTYKENSTFTYTPETVFGGDGQFIGGSCCGGFSVYGICPGERQPNSRLHFNTFYQIAREELSFFDDGGFERRTVERGANPIPDSSNFCGVLEGRVRPFLTEVFYSGHYTVEPAVLRPNAKDLHDSLALILNTETITPKNSGFGNGGGIIHYLDCRSLVLVSPDPEGSNQTLVKIYHSAIFEKWIEF
jgi:hypothetical protein